MSGFFAKLKTGLSRSAEKLGANISAAFVKRKLDNAALEELEEFLIAADLGTRASAAVIENFRDAKFGQSVTDREVKEELAKEIAGILETVSIPLVPDPTRKPYVILMVGVNGTGKTTTIGKLAAQYRDAGLTAVLAAGDTFRAAAVEQLQVWGGRAGAQAQQADVLLIDTAGRLHNKTALMEELQKIIRVIRKLDPSAPHATILTLDATSGQNAVAQVGVFKELVELTGLIVTKLDGSARGGVVVALADRYELPIHAVGTGEQAADLRDFEPSEFARALVGLS